MSTEDRAPFLKVAGVGRLYTLYLIDAAQNSEYV
jgi:hypothetical protein